MKTALLVMALIIGSAIFATFTPQINIYQSIWFRGLLFFLCINLLLCTAKRLPLLWKPFAKNPPVADYTNVGQNYTVPQVSQAEQDINKFFKTHRYTTRTHYNEQLTIISAHKGVLNYLAPHLLHISLLVIFVGAFIYSFGSSAEISCYVGQRTEIPDQIMPSISLKIDNFETIYDDQGEIDNWQSKIALVAGDEIVTTGTVKVNHPFKFKGVKFYQSAYGYHHRIKVSGENAGEYRIPSDHTFNLAGKNFRITDSGHGFAMYLSNGHTKQAIPLKAGQVVQFPNNTQMQYMQLAPFSVLNVKRTPGGGVIMLGLIAMSLSSLLFWGSKFRSINITINKQSNTLCYSVFCKDKELKQSLTEQLLPIIRR